MRLDRAQLPRLLAASSTNDVSTVRLRGSTRVMNPFACHLCHLPLDVGDEETAV
jgi:hypothetical protein